MLGQVPPLLFPPRLGPGSATLPHLHSHTPSPDTISWAAGAWICRWYSGLLVHIRSSKPRYHATGVHQAWELLDWHLWISANKLNLNTDKTEVLVVGHERKLSSFNLTAIRVAGCRVLVSDKPISNLDVSFDRNLSMCNQVHQVVRSAYFHLRSIWLARKMLTVAANKAASSGPSHLTPGLLQQPSDRNSNKPHEPARNGPTSSCSSHLSILRAPVCNCVDEGPTLVASHFPCPLQGPCPSIQVQKWTWSGVFDQYALCLHSSPWLTFSQLWAAGWAPIKAQDCRW